MAEPVSQTLPEVPKYTPPALPANPYNPTTQAKQYQTYAGFTSFLGRPPTEADIAYHAGLSQTPEQIYAGIGQSAEARTFGRARAEVGSATASRALAAQREMELARQAAQNELASFGPYFQRQRTGAEQAFEEAVAGYGRQRGLIGSDADIASRRLGEQINPAIRSAKEFAARRGLLDSTVTLDRINEGLRPLAQGLENIERGRLRSLEDLGITESLARRKFGTTLENLESERAQQERAVADAYRQFQESVQKQQQMEEALSGARVYARAGELGDLVYNQNLQKQQADQDYQKFLQQLALERDKFQEHIRQFNKR